MADLEIYDSKGQPLDGGPGAVNQQIKDFFFDGVRLALTRQAGGNIEVVCFFRARESRSSRAEQYYALFRTRSLTGGVNELKELVRRQIEDERGMELVTSADDTRVFDNLGAPGQESPKPGDTQVRRQLKTLVGNGHQIQVGVGKYSEALALLIDFAKDGKSAVISETTQNADYSNYDVLIKKGPYSGLELLGDTESKLKAMRKRRRARRAGPPSQGGSSGMSLGSIALVIVMVGGVVMLLLYGACIFAGIKLPVVGALPGMSCGVDDINWEVEGDPVLDNGSFIFNGTLKKEGSIVEGQRQLQLRLIANGTTMKNESENSTAGTFNISVQLGSPAPERVNYKLNLSDGTVVDSGEVESTPTPTRSPTTTTSTPTPTTDTSTPPPPITTTQPPTENQDPTISVDVQSFENPTDTIKIAEATIPNTDYEVGQFEIKVLNNSNESQEFNVTQMNENSYTDLNVSLNSLIRSDMTIKAAIFNDSVGEVASTTANITIHDRSNSG